MAHTDKIVVLDDLMNKIEEFKRCGKTVVQSHGVFDLIHPGVIAHLGSARAQGDILVVTVIKDKDVRRGPGRPIFPETLRAENVASLEMVNLVCIVDDEQPFSCIMKLKPDVFAKGEAYKDRDQKIHERLFREERELYFGKSKIYETGGFSFSSSDIISNFLDIYPPETKAYLSRMSQRYTFDTIVDELGGLKGMKVLLIGDGIIDEYHYCEPMGKSSKAILVVNRYLSHDVFAGGAFAVANHISGLCDDVHLVSLLGLENPREDFIAKSLRSNIKAKFFYRPDAPTIVKKRYINQYLNQKLFEVNYMNDVFVDSRLEADIISYLEPIIPDYDVVLVSDFGHGFVSQKLIGLIESTARCYAVNTQTNAANAGYNMITKYHNPHFVCLDEQEVRLSAQERHADIEKVAKQIARRVNCKSCIVTLGKLGSIGIDDHGDISRAPIVSTKVVDTVGAGDAFFSYTAPCSVRNLPMDLVCFIGNAVGALAVQIVCNKNSVEKYQLLEFLHTLLRN